MTSRKRTGNGSTKASTPRAVPRRRGYGRAGAEPMRPFAHSLPMALLRAREAVMLYFRTLHRHAGISEQQWRTLRALFDSGAIDVTTLAQRTYLQMPSLSRILRNLEGRGLIERRAHKGDQRRSLICISSRGRELIKGEGPISEERYAEINSRFGTARLNQLYALLEQLEEALAPSERRAPPRRPLSTKRTPKDTR